MQTRKERGVRNFEPLHRKGGQPVVDWGDAHLYLELIRLKSFRAAAEHLGLSVNALRTHISDFERSLGVTLVTRHVDGVRPTTEGERVFAIACQMEQSSFDLMQVSPPSERVLTGEVRLAITEGLGSLWVGSQITEFRQANPKLLVDVQAAMRSVDVLRMEADISVQLTRPVAKDLRVVKLGRLHLMLFASQAYIERFGQPQSVQDLIKHQLVLQADDTPEAQAFLHQVFPGERPEDLIALRSNFASLHYWSIVQGVGIGHLPTYVYALGAPVVPLEFALHRPVDIWMTYHAGAARIPRIRGLIDWLIKVFSPRQYPWFRDDFVLPSELIGQYRGTPLKNMFAGLSVNDRNSG